MDNTETGNNFIIGKFKENFSEEELFLLNKGMNYVLEESRLPIVDFEVAIQYHLTDGKKTVRKGLAKIILDIAKDKRANKRNKEVGIVRSLKEKPGFYINVDKEGYHELKKDSQN